MRHLDEYRDPAAVRAVLGRIEATVTRPWTLMEVCGGQTHSILKFGLDELLPKSVRLIHGPGCPVCVTPLEQIDRALAIAATPGVIFCSFGDMLRVPGSRGDLLTAKARGADVRIVYSPLDAVAIARGEPSRRVVFFAVGFETTAPANAMAVYTAARENLDNFSVLVAHVLVPPALESLLSIAGLRDPGTAGARSRLRRHRLPRLRADRAAPPDSDRGHRLRAPGSSVRRPRGRHPARARRGAGRKPVRASGRAGGKHRGAADRAGRCSRSAIASGAASARFAASGLTLTAAYARFDAERVFGLAELRVAEPADCRSGLVLQGRLRPTACPQFGGRCTPEHPLGATMVSSEGACAAYFHYGRGAAEGSP